MDSPQEHMKNVQNLKRNMEGNAEMVVLAASLIRTAYEALMREGFTDSEALDIIKARGATLG